MLHFLQNKYSPIGLDIGQTAIRAVQLRRQAGQQRLHVVLELPCKPLSPTTPATPSVLPAQPPASVHNHDLADTDTEALPNHSETDSGSDEQFIKQHALDNEKVKAALAGITVRKVIVIKNRLVNIVAN